MKYIENDIKIVAIGGGTGLSVLLRGLKKITTDITAVVSVADDGGGSGVLREDLGMLPPGDIRNCILALANTEPIMEALIQYRFKEGRLQGQSFGNLLIAALTGVSGSFENAIVHISDIVAITGKVLPVTTQQMSLVAELADGTVAEGESTIPKIVLQNNTKIHKIYTKEKDISAMSDVIDAIMDADIVIIGAGSLYTSIIPNFLVKGMSDALKMTKAVKIHIANLMTQPGETGGYSFLNHIDEIFEYVGEDCVDCVIANNEPISGQMLKKYQLDDAQPIYVSEEDKVYLLDRGIQVYLDNFVDTTIGKVRHDCDKISQLIIDIWKDKLHRLQEK